MAVTHQLNRRGTYSFHPQGFGCWLGDTSDNYSDGLLGFLIASAWAAHIPIFVSVDSQAKVSISKFKSDRRSKTFNGQAELTNRSDQPIRLAITCIPPTVTLINAPNLQLDGSPYVEVPWKDGISSSTGVKNENLR